MKNSKMIFAGLLLVTSCLITQTSYGTEIPANTQGQAVVSLSSMLQKVMPAVVNVNVRGEIPVVTDPFAEAPQEDEDESPTARKFESLGSGVIVDASHGYILTNAHLIRKAKSITIKLSDGRTMKAKLIGTDPESDIAVLQIPAEKLSALPLANSDELKVGDFVAAIGNPFGLNQTVTSGIISGLQRSDLHIEGYENFIQTDASINPGNSGGALVNMQGQLIGINTAILAASGGNIGISFAIPANMAKSVMEQLVKYGSMRRGVMGVLLQNLNQELATAFNTQLSSGALVTLVTPGSPAERAGFKAGDIIQQVNGKAVKDAFQVRNTIGLLRPGSPVSLQILRGGNPLTINLVTIDPKQYQQQTETSNPFLYGVALRDFDAQTPTGRQVKGVEVTNVAPNSAAWLAGMGLRPGDVIISANQMPVTHLAELKQATQQDKQKLLLNVLRQGGALYIVVK